MFGHTKTPIPRPPSRVVAFHRRGKKPHPGVLSTTLTMVRASSRARARRRRAGAAVETTAREGIVVPFVHRSFGRSVGRSLARSLGRSLGRRVRSAARRARASTSRSCVPGARARARGRETDASEARVIERVHRNDAFDDAVGDDVARARVAEAGQRKATSSGPAAAAATTHAERGGLGGGPVTTSDVHVLVVDDEENMSNGDVESVETVWVQGDDGVGGEEALELLRRGTEFHLLLTDVMMPGVDGPALLQIVRNDERLRDMPVVMMSANEHGESGV